MTSHLLDSSISTCLLHTIDHKIVRKQWLECTSSEKRSNQNIKSGCISLLLREQYRYFTNRKLSFLVKLI